MATEQIEIEIVLDDGSVQKGFAKINKESKKTGANIAAGLGKSFLKLGAVAGAAALAIGGVVAAKGIAAAREQEEAVNALATALRKTGEAARLPEFEAFASELQSVTKFGDEAILSQLAFAQAMGASADQSKGILEAATDMSAALNIDLNAAVRNISKTLGGYAGELGEVIPELKNLTAEQLRAGEGVDLLAKKYEGFARAEIKTFGGAMTQLGNSFGEFLEGIGDFIVKSPAFVKVVNIVSDSFGEISKSLKAAAGADFVKDFIINFSVVAQAAAETGRRIGLSFELGFLRAQQAFLAFKVASTLGLSETFNAELDAVLTKIEETKNAFSEDSAITKFFNNLILKVQESNMAITESVNTTAEATSLVADTTSLSFANIAANLKGAAKEIKISSKDIAKSLITGVASGAGNAFAAFGKALATGEDALGAFLNSLIASMGQMAIQLGTQFILQGLAYLWAGLPNGGALIAAGAALATFGGVLSAVGGGGASADGGASSEELTPTIGDADGLTTPDDEGDLPQQQSAVTINVEGTVIDPKTTGENIAASLQEFFDASGGQLVVNT